jgi:hypothetical protein
LENPSVQDVASVTGLPVDTIHLGGVAGEGDEAADSEDGSDVEAKTFHLNIQQTQIVPVLQSLMGKFQITDMGVEEQSLERVIQKLYEEDRVSAETRS